jgi:AcrR family transcriptional regulator
VTFVTHTPSGATLSGMVPDPATSLRERKKQRTRRDLQESAFELFEAKGFDHVTCEDIAAAAEVSKTTFYRYFDSKEDVLLGSIDERMAEFQAALDAQPPGRAAMPALRSAIMDMADRYEDDRELMLAKGRLIRSTPSLATRSLEQQARWEDLLARFLAERSDLGDPDSLAVRVLTASALAAMRVAINRWQIDEGRGDLHQLLDQALRLVEGGAPLA